MKIEVSCSNKHELTTFMNAIIRSDNGEHPNRCNKPCSRYGKENCINLIIRDDDK